jgi:hypothetical protein
MAESAPIDWQALAERLQTIATKNGETRTEVGGTALARAAIAWLIEPERLATAVDHYVSLNPGFELARSVLWLLHPWAAMVRCREIATSDVDVNRRRSAVELLRVVADGRALPWVQDFLADPDEETQVWAIGIVDQLLFSRLIEPEACADLLAVAQIHDNARVRRAAAEIGARLRGLGD